MSSIGQNPQPFSNAFYVGRLPQNFNFSFQPPALPQQSLREIIDAGNEIEKVDKPPKKRGRGTTGKPKGRPPGAKNKPKPEDDGLPKGPKKKGRPPGAKNKPKDDHIDQLFTSPPTIPENETLGSFWEDQPTFGGDFAYASNNSNNLSDGPVQYQSPGPEIPLDPRLAEDVPLSKDDPLYDQKFEAVITEWLNEYDKTHPDP